MKFGKRLKNRIKRGRFKKFISVNFRWTLRRVRRFFRRDEFARGIKGAYARRLYVALGLLLAISGLIIGADALSHNWLADEAVLVRRLSDPDFDRKNPNLAALNCFGITNRIQVTVQTERRDNLQPVEVDLDHGNINLVMTLKNGGIMEYTLQNRNIDNFESGNTDQFTLILPPTVSVFDITDYKLVLMPDAKGKYDTWHCRWAQISFLLGGKRTLLAEDNWRETLVFSKDQLTAELIPVAVENPYYVQVSQLFPYVKSVCENGYETVHTKEMKTEALRALGLSEGNVLYLDVETVGLEMQNALVQSSMGKVSLSEYDLMDYDGTMTLRVQFYSDAGGAYYKDYTLDTLGKDDFELGNTSTFALEMPDGMSAFDILSMELLVHDAEDLWAPRMVRAYLRTDFGTALELARINDQTLTTARRTCVFHRDLIETAISPVKLDLTATNQLPLALKEQIEKKFYTEIKGVVYSMYFNDFNFYERQKLFYSQVLSLYGGTDEKA